MFKVLEYSFLKVLKFRFGYKQFGSGIAYFSVNRHWVFRKILGLKNHPKKMHKKLDNVPRALGLGVNFPGGKRVREMPALLYAGSSKSTKLFNPNAFTTM